MNKVEMLICLEKIHPVPFQFIHWTHEEKLHLESFLQFTTPRLTLQNKTFCIPRKLTCRGSFEIYPSQRYKDYSWTFWNFTNTLTLQINTFNIWIKLTCWFILLDLPALSPTKHLFNVWISMASWLMLKCSLPSPTKLYIEHMKKRNLESFLKFTAHRPYKTTRWTYGEISHVEWCLGFPSLRPCRTNGLRYEESCHAESFLKSTSPRPYLASNPLQQMNKLGMWSHC